MPFQSDRPYTFDRVVRIAITIIIVLALVWLLQRLQSVLVPFAIALILAYLINPLTLFFEKRINLKARWLQILLSLLVIGGCATGIGALVIPQITEEGKHMAELVDQYAEDREIQDRVKSYLPESFADWANEQLGSSETQDLFKTLNWEKILQTLGTGLGGVFSGGIWLFGLLGTMLLVFLYLIFILLDYNTIVNNWKKWVPEKQRQWSVKIMDDLEDGMNKYFRAQGLISIILGILFAIGFSAISLPMGILFGFFVGALNMIPYMQLTALIPAAFLALLRSMETGQSFWVIMGLVILVFAICQLVQELLLNPKILGNATGMNPAIILLSLSIWGSLLGILGLIIALPVTTIILSYYRKFLMKQKLIED